MQMHYIYSSKIYIYVYLYKREKETAINNIIYIVLLDYFEKVRLFSYIQIVIWSSENISHKLLDAVPYTQN